ncbi:hypothetical protein RHMOL_Rhmol07G0179700 [Rhododendron molle]|uniref:Uncharacterized protein n=1 Tax=Rhododendron molle TaxID=49168 RepID=A0ACC0N1R2_RHOML|nr:hypothetical protein RHMOL_Rhmol07G0179700 [Rhododendron molle]
MESGLGLGRRTEEMRREWREEATWEGVVGVGLKVKPTVEGREVVGVVRREKRRRRSGGGTGGGKWIPLWWRWYYYVCPVSWSLYGLVGSQYGDVEERLDTGETVEHFVVKYFDFRHDFVGYVALIMLGIVLLFGLIFAFSIKSFNFQKR